MGASNRIPVLVVSIVLPVVVAVAPPVTGNGDEDRDRRAVARARDGALGLPPPPFHETPTSAEVRLGRKLFLDRRLSRNGTMSCAMCHVPEQGFTSHEMRTAVGLEGRSLPRNAPTLINTAWHGPWFHDGREPDLEMQPFDVLLNADEMGLPSLGAAVERVRSLPEYPPLFEEAYDGPVTVETIGRALAAYLRTLVAGGSPFDRWWFGGEEGAVDDSVRRGFGLFRGRAGCASCHVVGEEDALFTDGGFHDTGIGYLSEARKRAAEPVAIELAPGVVTEVARSVLLSVGDPLPPDPGRQRITGAPEDRWKFKTPSLRNVALTAPYMHDGVLSTLEEVVDHYAKGAASHPGLDPLLRPIDLSPAERRDLVAFLESLTGAGIDELVADARSESVGNGPVGRGSYD